MKNKHKIIYGVLTVLILVLTGAFIVMYQELQNTKELLTSIESTTSTDLPVTHNTTDELVIEEVTEEVTEEYSVVTDTEVIDDLFTEVYTAVTNTYPGISSFKYSTLYDAESNTYKVKILNTTITVTLDVNDVTNYNVTHMPSYVNTRLDFQQVDWLSKGSILIIDKCLENIESNAITICDAVLSNNIVDVTTNTGSTYTIDLETEELITD